VLSGGCGLLAGGAKHFLEFLKMIFNYLFIFRFYVSTAAMSPYLMPFRVGILSGDVLSGSISQA
jgi:hypothetical protein